MTGKTTWARSLGNHLYMRARLNAKSALLAEGVDYAVIDDISGGITFFPHWKDWFGGQPMVQVKALYKDDVLLKWGKPTIWLSNRDPRAQLFDNQSAKYSADQYEDDIKWLEGNCIFVYVDSPIVTFHASTE
jgi:hypothetical protein